MENEYKLFSFSPAIERPWIGFTCIIDIDTIYSSTYNPSTERATYVAALSHPSFHQQRYCSLEQFFFASIEKSYIEKLDQSSHIQIAPCLFLQMRRKLTTVVFILFLLRETFFLGTANHTLSPNRSKRGCDDPPAAGTGICSPASSNCGLLAKVWVMELKKFRSIDIFLAKLAWSLLGDDKFFNILKT